MKQRMVVHAQRATLLARYIATKKRNSSSLLFDNFTLLDLPTTNESVKFVREKLNCKEETYTAVVSSKASVYSCILRNF